jgi:hypothetical protein
MGNKEKRFTVGESDRKTKKKGTVSILGGKGVKGIKEKKLKLSLGRERVTGKQRKKVPYQYWGEGGEGN